MPHIVETHRRLVVHSPMRGGLRLFLGLVALFPLLAPYELIIKPDWETYFNVFFLFVAVISLGALSVSGFFVWAAIAGISSVMTFNKANKTFTFSAQAPVMPRREQSFPLRSVRSVGIETHESSDSGDSYTLLVELEDGQRFESASSWTRTEIEHMRDRVAAFLARP